MIGKAIIPLALLATVGSQASAKEKETGWSIGVEREVDDGVYMSLVAVQNGWSIWKTERANGVSCKAAKAAKGRRSPAPSGRSDRLSGGTPFLTVEEWTRRGALSQLEYNWSGEFTYLSSIKTRKVGERFFDGGAPSGFREAGMARYSPSDVIEIVIETQHHQYIPRPWSEERALFEVQGMDWAIEKIRECNQVFQ